MYLQYYFLYLTFIIGLVIIYTYVLIRYTCIIFAFLSLKTMSWTHEENFSSEFASFEQFRLKFSYTACYVVYSEER